MVTAYVALDDRMVIARSTHNWRPNVSYHADRLECLGVSAGSPERVFVGTVEEGLQRSTDSGETFERVGAGTIDDRVTAVVISPHDPETVWVGTEPSRVYRSIDGGHSWVLRADLTALPSASKWSFPPRPETHHVRGIEPDPHDPGRLYVAIEAGALLRSDDAGETWQASPGARRDNHTIATHPHAPGRLSVAAGDGYAESIDGGTSWRYPQDGLEHRYLWSIAVDPTDPERQIVSAASSARHAHSPGTAEAYVYRRSTGKWSKDMNGLPEGHTRAVLDAHEQTFYAVTDRGLYRRGMAEEAWTTVTEWPDGWEVPIAHGLAVRP